MVNDFQSEKSLERWIWDAACSIRGAQDAPKFKDYILPLIFVKRLCDVFDDEINRIAQKVGGRTKAFALVEKDRKLVRFYLPIKPQDLEGEEVWSVIRKLSDKIGERLTTYLRDIARENPELSGIIDRVDFNATYRGQREIDDDRLSNLIEQISKKRLGLKDVEPDIIGRSYEYLIRKFAEGSGQSAGEFYTPKEVGILMAKIMSPEPGMEIYDPCCGSGGLLVKCQLELENKRSEIKLKQDLEKELSGRQTTQMIPLKLYGQELFAGTWAMAKMNMIIHDMEGEIEVGDTMKTPKFRSGGKLKTFDMVVTNPMWNQTGFPESLYINDELNRFPAGYPGSKADWGWVQHVYASLKPEGRAAIVLDTGVVSRGSGNASSNKEKETRKWFVDNDIIEAVLYLPENLFYNTTAPGIILILNKKKKLKNKIIMINASEHYLKGDPKNYLPDATIAEIHNWYTDFLRGKKTEGKEYKLVDYETIKENDYNISPSRYIHVGKDEEHRPIEEIVAELKTIEKEAQKTDKEGWKILEKLGYE